MVRLPAVLTLVLLGVPSALAQAGPADPAPFLSHFTVGLGYNNVRANAPPADCGCFDMNGGFLSASLRLNYWLSAAAEVTGGHANDIGPLHQNLTLTTYTAGPRISFRMARVVPFVQALFGGAYGTDSYFPSATGPTDSAAGFALSTGGGLDVPVNHRLDIRAIEAQYLRTSLPNGSNGYENQLMLGAGLVFRFGGHYAQPHLHHAKAESAPVPAPVPQPAIAAEAAPPPPVQEPSHTSLNDAYFDYNSYALRPDAQQAIASLAAYLSANPLVNILIGGYADERGTVEYNFELGKERADAARGALVAAGISGVRIKTISYGKGEQVCEEQDSACWQRNRRVNFSVEP